MCDELLDRELINELDKKYKELNNYNNFINYFLNGYLYEIPLVILYIKHLFNKIIKCDTQIRNFLIDDDNRLVGKLNWITSRCKNKKSVLENIYDNLEIIKLIFNLQSYEEDIIKHIFYKTRFCTCCCDNCKKLHNRNFTDNIITDSIKFYTIYDENKLKKYEFTYDLNYLDFEVNKKRIVLNTFLVDIDSKFEEKNIKEEREIKETLKRFTTLCDLVDNRIDQSFVDDNKKIVGKRKNYKDNEKYFKDRKRIKLIIETELNSFYTKYKDIERKRIRESATPLSRIIQVFKKSESTSPVLLVDSNSPTLAF